MRTSRIRRKIDEQHKFSLDAEFTETEKWSGKCSYSERNDINREHLFSAWLKTTKKERKKNNNKLNFQPEPFEVLHMLLTNRYARYTLLLHFMVK